MVVVSNRFHVKPPFERSLCLRLVSYLLWRNRQTCDIVLFHQVRDIFEQYIFRDGEWLLRHGFAARWGAPEPEPSRSLGRRPCFRCVPISARRMKSLSETKPISFPLASTTGSLLMGFAA
jgi:hypothetical protein